MSDLQLDESFVSQWHAVIRFDADRTTFLDLGSTNPTLVDGQAVKRNVEIEVSERSDIRIGSLRLHVLRVDAPAELFGARRKTSFVRAGPQSFNSVEATFFLGANAGAARISQPLAAAASLLAPAARAASGAPLSSSPPTAAGVSSQPRLALAERAPAGHGLAGAYRDYQASRARVLSEVRRQLDAQTGAAREGALDALVRDYPELAHEPEFRDLIGTLGMDSWRSGVPDVADWLRRLTGGMFPAPGVACNDALALERIGEVLEVFSAAFVELRNAHEQFCDEMSLEKPAGESLLDTTKSPRAVLAYLLNSDTKQQSRVTDLARAMADYAVHQVALVSAVVEGARELLQGLSPEALAAPAPQQASTFFGNWLGHETRAYWARYVTVFGELVDEDRFARKLFGRRFARKYFEITGGRRSTAAPAPKKSATS